MNHQLNGFGGMRYGGRPVYGFALGAAGDPDAYAGLTSDQQYWVQNTLNALNSAVTLNTGTTCDAFVNPAVNMAAAVGCFQQWYNANFTQQSGVPPLRTDGVFDSDTLAGLKMVVTTPPISGWTSFDPFPGGGAAPAGGGGAVTPAPGTAPAKKLSTGAMVGIGVAAAAGVGGIIYAATRGGGKKRGRRRH